MFVSSSQSSTWKVWDPGCLIVKSSKFRKKWELKVWRKLDIAWHCMAGWFNVLHIASCRSLCLIVFFGFLWVLQALNTSTLRRGTCKRGMTWHCMHGGMTLWLSECRRIDCHTEQFFGSMTVMSDGFWFVLSAFVTHFGRDLCYALLCPATLALLIAHSAWSSLELHACLCQASWLHADPKAQDKKWLWKSMKAICISKHFQATKVYKLLKGKQNDSKLLYVFCFACHAPVKCHIISCQVTSLKTPYRPHDSCEMIHTLEAESRGQSSRCYVCSRDSSIVKSFHNMLCLGHTCSFCYMPCEYFWWTTIVTCHMLSFI